MHGLRMSYTLKFPPATWIGLATRSCTSSAAMKPLLWSRLGLIFQGTSFKHKRQDDSIEPNPYLADDKGYRAHNVPLQRVAGVDAKTT